MSSTSTAPRIHNRRQTTKLSENTNMRVCQRTCCTHKSCLSGFHTRLPNVWAKCPMMRRTSSYSRCTLPHWRWGFWKRKVLQLSWNLNTVHINTQFYSIVWQATFRKEFVEILQPWPGREKLYPTTIDWSFKQWPRPSKRRLAAATIAPPDHFGWPCSQDRPAGRQASSPRQLWACRGLRPSRGTRHISNTLSHHRRLHQASHGPQQWNSRQIEYGKGKSLQRRRKRSTIRRAAPPHLVLLLEPVNLHLQLLLHMAPATRGHHAERLRRRVHYCRVVQDPRLWQVAQIATDHVHRELWHGRQNAMVHLCEKMKWMNFKASTAVSPAA